MKFGYTINNKLMMNSNGKLIGIDPYNPLNLPQGTIRVRTNDGQPPKYLNYKGYDSATLVSGTTDVYDVFKSGDSFGAILDHSYNLVEILGGNTYNVTNMNYMFYYCPSLSSVSLFDTRNVTAMEEAFHDCSSLSSVPLFDTRNVINMNRMFLRCVNVQSGALALYQQASTHSAVTKHIRTFTDCGINTETGSAELAQIPSDWK